MASSPRSPASSATRWRATPTRRQATRDPGPSRARMSTPPVLANSYGDLLSRRSAAPVPRRVGRAARRALDPRIDARPVRQLRPGGAARPAGQVDRAVGPRRHGDRVAGRPLGPDRQLDSAVPRDGRPGRPRLRRAPRRLCLAVHAQPPHGGQRPPGPPRRRRSDPVLRRARALIRRERVGGVGARNRRGRGVQPEAGEADPGRLRCQVPPARGPRRTRRPSASSAPTSHPKRWSSTRPRSGRWSTCTSGMPRGGTRSMASPARSG